MKNLTKIGLIYTAKFLLNFRAKKSKWIPAFAGMTDAGVESESGKLSFSQKITRQSMLCKAISMTLTDICLNRLLVYYLVGTFSCLSSAVTLPARFFALLAVCSLSNHEPSICT